MTRRLLVPQWFRPAACVVVAAWAVVARPAAAYGQTPGIAERPNQVTGSEITPEQQRAVERGLNWLAANQGKDGSYTMNGQPHAGITALAGLAFMQNGSLPGRGPFGVQVERALNYVVSAAQDSGLIATDMSQGPMYGHGFATLFLAEIYGMTGDERVRDRLQRAVRLIQRSQNHEGGWRYQPAPLDADISVTICQVMALRAARDAGLKVEKSVIDRAIQYVRRCQNPDGGFSYMANQGHGGGGSGFARSAAGVASLYYAGVFEGDDLQRGLRYLGQFIPGRPGPGAVLGPEIEGHYFYGQYYAVQAMFLAGGTHWASYYPAIRDQLISRQRPNGSWEDNISADYSTAMALIILQMPNRYLPVYTGKGPGG